MGTDPAGEKIRDHIKRMAPLLQDKSVSANDKLRLILLYVINKGGDTRCRLLRLRSLGFLESPGFFFSIVLILQVFSSD